MAHRLRLQNTMNHTCSLGTLPPGAPFRYPRSTQDRLYMRAEISRDARAQGLAPAFDYVVVCSLTTGVLYVDRYDHEVVPVQAGTTLVVEDTEA